MTTTIESTQRRRVLPGRRDDDGQGARGARSGRLLGRADRRAGRDSAKRIDVFAAAIWNDMGVEEMTFMDLSYAPPFSPAWDAVLVAARKAAKEVEADSPASPA